MAKNHDGWFSVIIGGIPLVFPFLLLVPILSIVMSIVAIYLGFRSLGESKIPSMIGIGLGIVGLLWAGGLMLRV